MILAIRRGERVMPMSEDLALRTGDLAAVAVYVPEREEAQRALAERGWSSHESSERPEDVAEGG